MYGKTCSELSDVSTSKKTKKGLVNGGTNGRVWRSVYNTTWSWSSTVQQMKYVVVLYLVLVIRALFCHVNYYYYNYCVADGRWCVHAPPSEGFKRLPNTHRSTHTHTHTIRKVAAIATAKTEVVTNFSITCSHEHTHTHTRT